MSRVRRFVPGLFAVWLLLLPSIASIARAECPEYHLGGPISLTVGWNPLYTVAADFNEDGRLDLAVSVSEANTSGSGYLAILLATGPRTYASPVHYTVGGSPRGIALGDFNEDGVLDLAVANMESDFVSILSGNGVDGVGDGTFGTAANFFAGSAPFHIVADDFDHDGITDLATSLNIPTEVAVLRGLGSDGVGNGTFGSPTILMLNNRPCGIDKGDWNGDGNTDLVATEYYDHTIALFLGDGAGGFAPAVHIGAGTEAFDFAVADFNGDSKQDLAVANTSYSGTAVLLGDGAGGFGSPSFLGSANTAVVEPFDLDQDGKLDLITGFCTGGNGGEVRVFLGNGDGTFGSAQVSDYGSDAYQITPGDFDGDGHNDLLVANYLRNYITLLPGSCDAIPTPEPVLLDVRDVPNDQGGKVILTWTASSLDVQGGSVTSYRVWRRVLDAAAVSAGLPATDVLRTNQGLGTEQAADVYWEALATLPAQRLSGYGYTAATPQDSIAGSNPYSSFFITAATNDIDVFYSSNIDSGYSVDNIPPEVPAALAGSRQEMGYVLTWQEPPLTPDLEAYNVYRGATENFVPSAANRIAMVNGLEFMDLHRIGAEFYKLTARDTHGNEGSFALLPPTAVAGVGDATIEFGLRRVLPNPSQNGELTVDLSLARGGAGRIEVLDLAGRRVATRELGSTPGAQTVRFRGSERLPVGVYLVRVLQNGQAREMKAVVVR